LAAQTPEQSPLPGKEMAQHPFLYCGEWQNRSTSQQTIHIVRDGKIDWSYTNPLKGELGDCSMLSNGNIVFSRQFGASEITPDKKIVWNYDGPPGTEIHTAYPLDKNRVLIMQNGNPAKLLVINRAGNRVEKELILPHEHPALTASSGTYASPRPVPFWSRIWIWEKLSSTTATVRNCGRCPPLLRGPRFVSRTETLSSVETSTATCGK
jgi:hypothetical protein